MPDKTKATLVKELAEANRRAKKAEKAVAKAEEEAEEGVAAATAKIAELEATISGRSHNSDGHVCPRTGAALGRDADVYATEARLRAERNDWRSFSGGVAGMRGSSELAPKATPSSVPKATIPPLNTSGMVKSESLLRQERDAARKAAGGHAGQRGPNNTKPGSGLSTSARLLAETEAWFTHLANQGQDANPQAVAKSEATPKKSVEASGLVASIASIASQLPHNVHITIN